MRIVSKKTQYSLRALCLLAANHGQGPILISALAERGRIPRKFLAQILLTLKSGGAVKSKTGRGGGYQLGRPPSQITIGSIVRLIDGSLAPLPCASETEFRPCEECIALEECGTRLLMLEIRAAAARILDNTTLADVCQMARNKAVSASQGP